MLMNTEKARERENKDNRKVCRRRLFACTGVEHCSQGISVRKANEAERWSVFKSVCLLL